MLNAFGKETYVNPILDEGADPWIIKAGGYYYLCGSDGRHSIYITRVSEPQELRRGEKFLVFKALEGTNHSDEVWAPELHFIYGRWYIYFAADDGCNENHRMFVLQGGCNKENPLEGDYVYIDKITDHLDRWAIDGTVMTWNNQLYFIWSGWEGYENRKQDLYIAPMSNPWTISGESVCISTPDQDWEKIGEPWVNEGPEVLIKGNTIHIIYSASGSWTNDYCLGRLTCRNGDIMNPKAWIKEGPVFSKTNKVFGPGHASFIKSFDEKQDFIVYHAAIRDGSGWDRNIRMQRFTWEGDIPHFGSPVAEGITLKSPSKENTLYVLNNE